MTTLPTNSLRGSSSLTPRSSKSILTRSDNMTSSTRSNEFPILQEQVALYFFWSTVIGLLCFSFFFGVGILLAMVYALVWGSTLPQKQAAALHFWLDGSTLRVDQGVYFLKRKAIPLDRITDLMLTQGPLLRHFGLWSLSVQTAGAGGQAI